jgi:hypothetical protein
LVALLRRKKPPVEAPPQEAAPPPAPLSADYDRLFVLIPEGAYTYQVVVFTDVKSAGAWADTYLLPTQSVHAFWSSDPDRPRNRSQQGEAVVLVAEDNRPEIVRPYSFTDVESARSFLSAETTGGLGDSPFLFWAEPVSIPRGLTPPTTVAPDTPRRQPAPTHPRPAAPAGGPALAAASASPATAGVAVADVPGRPGLISRINDWPAWEGLGPRMVAASRADKAIYYDAVDDDEYADGRAALIVLVGAFAAGIGALGVSASAPLWHFGGAIVGWLLCVSVVQLVAKTLLPGERPKHAVRRLAVAMGLAFSPAIFLVFGAIPTFGPMFTLAVLGWLAVTAVVAVETALELDRESAMLTAVPGWVILFATMLIVPQFLA